ncbi:hypothetical protein D3C78_1879690 [compost metagenome]
MPQRGPCHAECQVLAARDEFAVAKRDDVPIGRGELEHHWPGVRSDEFDLKLGGIVGPTRKFGHHIECLEMGLG